MELDDRLRLADLLSALSLETDLAMGHPPEEAMRTCLLATRLARLTRLDERVVADVYWTALLMHVGCTAFAHEQAALFGGDEIAVNDVGSRTDTEQPREMLAMLLELSRESRLLDRARLIFMAAARGSRFGRDLATATCEVAATTAERLGLPPTVQQSLDHLFERWDGKGAPGGLKGEEIELPARLAQLAAQVIVFNRLGGTDAAIEMVRARSGAALDPQLGETFQRHGVGMLEEIDACDPWQAVLEEEPAPQRRIPESDLDHVASAFADVVDLKSVYTLGHSSRVSELSEAAGREAGLPQSELIILRRAGYLHDLGKVGVPNGIWEKRGPLTAAEWEVVRLHPYHSERMLSRSPTLEPLAAIAGMHHERLDGSGYYRRPSPTSISMPARLLAAADMYVGRTERRAHRPALAPSAAAEDLANEAREGRLDAEAVEAVLEAAGHGRVDVSRSEWPEGLTDREVDVLRLLSRGLSNREIGDKLYISPKTAGRHIENLYQKLDVSSRPAAALFALRNDLLRGIEDW